MTELGAPDLVSVGLNRIRRLRALFKCILLAFAPVVSGVFFLGLSEQTVVGTAVLMVGVGVILEIGIFFSRCPACRGYFHVRGVSGSMFARKCLHCGTSLSWRDGEAGT